MMRSAVKTRPAGRRSSQACATSSVVRPRPLRSSRSRAMRGKLRSSSSGMPSMFSARLVGRLRRFHGYCAAMAGSSPTSVKYEWSGQLPVARAMARMPSSGSFSTGLPRRQPAARPSQAPCTRSARSARVFSGSSGTATVARIASRSSGSSVSSRSGSGIRSISVRRSRASVRRASDAGSGEAPLQTGSGAPPAASQRSRTSAVSRPSRFAAASACGRRSSGWVQLRRIISWLQRIRCGPWRRGRHVRRRRPTRRGRRRRSRARWR